MAGDKWCNIAPNSWTIVAARSRSLVLAADFALPPAPPDPRSLPIDVRPSF
jgi:hypothetical protein